MRIFSLFAVAYAACPDIAPGQYRAALGYDRFVTVTKTAGSYELGIEISSLENDGTSESSTLEYSIEADCSLNVPGLNESYGTVRFDAAREGIAVGTSLFLERV